MTSNKTKSGGSTTIRLLAVVGCALLFTVVTGLVYGRWTQRWGPVPNLVAKGKQLETMPKEIGEWVLLKEGALSELVKETLSCTGYVHRDYVHRKTGEHVSMAIYVGPGGPIAVHTPEICYSSRAFAIQEPRQPAHIKGASGNDHSFWKLTFRPANPSANLLRVYYGWTTDGAWTASDSPRVEFGGRPALYKLQISSPIPAGDAKGEQDPCKHFLVDLLQSSWKPESEAVN